VLLNHVDFHCFLVGFWW